MTESNPSLRQIGNQSLSEQAADILRRAILNGQFKPGDTLNETDLAEQLGTSRGPIREALRILNTEGLAETVPYHGTRVRSFARRDIEELYSMRVLLETFAVRRIIDEKLLDEITSLRDAYNHMMQAARADDLQQLNGADRDFHDTLIQLSDHHLLESLWQMVAMRIQQVMAINNRRFDNLQEIASNHLNIIQAIEDGDTDTACDLLRDHIVSAGDLVVEGWQPAENDDEKNATDRGGINDK